MKNIFLLLIICSLTLNGWSQSVETDFREEWQFGLKIGTNYSNTYSESGASFKSNSKIGFATGLFTTIPISKYVGIQPEILYSEKGFQATGMILGESYDFTRTTSYIDIPIYLLLKPSEFISLMAGPQYSFLIHQRDVFKNASSSIAQEQEFENDSYRKNTFCFAGGADINIDHIVCF